MFELTLLEGPRPITGKHYPTRREYKSPTSDLIAVFHNAQEIQMGVVGWHFSVFDGDTDITEKFSLNQYPYYFVPDHYQPWAYNGEYLCILPLQSDTLEAKIAYISFSDYSIRYSKASKSSIVLCSPNSSKILMAEYFEQSHTLIPYITNFDGSKQIDIPIEAKAPNLFLSWLLISPNFILITTDSTNKITIIYYCNGDSGNIISQKQLNSDELVPYNIEKYREIKRDEFSLITPEAWALGTYLDQWKDIHFDIETGILFLTIYRPVGDIDIREEGKFVNVEEIGIKVQITVS